jgi:hypothetical protein
MELSWIIVSRISLVTESTRSGIARKRARCRIHSVFGKASAICLEWRRSVEVCGVDVERGKK